MAGIIDMLKFAFGVEEIRQMSKMMFDELVKGGDFAKFHQIWPGIVTDKEVGFIGDPSITGVADDGCDGIAQEFSIGTRKLVWEPKKWVTFIKQCYTDLENIAAVYELKTGVDISDFTGTQYQAIVIQKFEEALINQMWRWAWLGDTGALNVTGGGVITDGVDVKHFTLVDGFFKQMLALAPVGSKQRVVISKNAGTDYAAQDITGAEAKELLKKMWKNASIQLKTAGDKVLYVTRTIYDAYEETLSNSTGDVTEAGRTAGIEGTKVVKFKGMPLIPIDYWDKMINEYENTGEKWNNPNRAVFTTKGVLAVGLDSKNSFEDFRSWYDIDTENVKTRAKGKVDVKLADPGLFVIGI